MLPINCAGIVTCPNNIDNTVINSISRGVMRQITARVIAITVRVIALVFFQLIVLWQEVFSFPAFPPRGAPVLEKNPLTHSKNAY